MISTMSSNYSSFLGSMVVPGPMGTAFPTIVPYKVYRGSDRDFALAVGSEKLWAAFCGVLKRPEIESDPRFATNAERIRNREEFERLLDHIFLGQTADEWVSQLRAAGIPSSLVRNFAEVVDDPQSALRGMFPALEHSKAGMHRVTGTPVKLRDTPGRVSRPAPLLGQDTRETLKTLLSSNDREIDDWIARGVVVQNNTTTT
jgi:crotonobetainyl-CoA:carnitine CoA-transferase CaiB-like acyl-CoA transferase